MQKSAATAAARAGSDDLNSKPMVCRLLPLILCFGGAADPAAAQRSADAISWSPDRPLVWEDFRGRVDPGATASTVATTAATLSSTYSYELERSRGRCSYRVTEIVTEALFNPSQSWVRPAHATAAVLEHEQGHFDLTQIHKMMLDETARDIEGKQRSCGDPEATLAKVESKVAEEVGPVRERVWQDLQRVQDQYDAETGHGMFVEAQREWTSRIREALRRGRWD